MKLGTFVEKVAATYDRNASMRSDAQDLLRSAGSKLEALARGYKIVGRGGMGQGAHVPWVAVFDPDETESATRGLYVVYLFAADMSTISLSLNQGVTEARSKWRSEARGRLAQQSTAIRDQLEPSLMSGLTSTIDLKHTSQLGPTRSTACQTSRTCEPISSGSFSSTRSRSMSVMASQ